MRHVAISVLLYACLLTVSVTSFAFRPLVFAILLLLVLANQYLQTRVILRRNIPGQIQIRSQQKSLDGIIILAVTLVLLLFIMEGGEQVYFTAVWCSFLLSDIFEDYLYRKHKPVTIVIDHNELIFSGITTTKRDLETLTAIRLNGVTNDLVCSFSGSSSIAFKHRDYKKTDIELFIEEAKSKSLYPVEVSTNLVVHSHQ